MSLGKCFLSASLLAISCSMLVAADEPKPIATPATQPVETKAVRRARVIEPWSLLKDLTPEQTSQIEKIHGDALEQTDKIRAKEKDDITAVLTPQQLTELKVAEAKRSLDAKERKAEKLKDAATTKPMK